MGQANIKRLMNAISGETSSNYIWVDSGRSDVYVEDGGIQFPYKTLSAAVSAATSTRNKIMCLPGAETITATITLPSHDLSISGIGAQGICAINAAATVTPLFNIAPSSLSATVVYQFANIYIDNAETSQIGIQVDNADAGKKILIMMDAVVMSDGGTCIDVDHDGASDAVRIYIDNMGREIEGNIVFDVGNDGDRLYINNANIGGTINSTGDNTTFELRLKDCIVPHGAAATNGGSTSQLCIAARCISKTGTTYAALDTNDIGAGSKYTETII